MWHKFSMWRTCLPSREKRKDKEANASYDEPKRHIVLSGKRNIVGVDDKTDKSEDYEKFDEIAPFTVNIDPSIPLNDEDFPWLRRKGTHAKKKFHTQRSGMWSASLSSLSSVFHTQEGISVIVRGVMCFGIWNAKKFYVQANSFMHLLIFSAKWPWNWKAFQMNSEKDESWHGIIISPT